MQGDDEEEKSQQSQSINPSSRADDGMLARL